MTTEIDAEEYEAWREHPITKRVFAVLNDRAEDRKQLWIAQSWNGGDADERKLAMLKGQAEAFEWLPKATHEDIFGESE